jgi:gamma-glutamyltranspeptidase/glutathione hydrolase
VAVSAALAVVEPSSSGLGGGGFYLLHRQSDGFETMLDAREKAPGAATRDMYLDKAGNEIENASIDGPLAAGIPGEPAAFDYLARKYGKLPLEAKPAAGDPLWRGKAFPCMRACKAASASRRISWRARRKPRGRF